MAALQCEICGGKLMAKSGGLFECEFCGMQYDKLRIQEMVQEIKGTVKVEGTVQVTGAVKVEGSATKESLLKNAFVKLEERNWRDANSRFEQVLDIDPECAKAYLGKLMVEKKVNKPDGVASLNEPFEDNANYIKAMRYADDDLRSTLSGYLETVYKRNEEVAKRNEEARIAEEHRKEQQRIADEKKSNQNKIKLEPIRKKLQPVQGLLIADAFHTIGLKSDGTVVSVGRNRDGYYYVHNWEDIVAIASSFTHVVGVKSDGTVVAYGNNRNNQCDVHSWRNIVAVSAGHDHTIGLKRDGTVVATGRNIYKQCDVRGWKDIVAISAGSNYTVGLKKDGTVIATGDRYGTEGLDSWCNIIAISAGSSHTVGLKADGTVVATGNNSDGECDLNHWEDIVAVSAGGYHTIGLKSDGTVVAAGSNCDGQSKVESWRNIVAVAAGSDHTAGLKSDGTIVVTRYTGFGPDNSERTHVGAMRLFVDYNNISEERILGRQMRQRRSHGLCQHCGGELKGLFSKKCVSCGHPKDY